MNATIFPVSKEVLHEALQSRCSVMITYFFLPSKNCVLSEFQSCIFHGIVFFTLNTRVILVVITADEKSFRPKSMKTNAINHERPISNPSFAISRTLATIHQQQTASWHEPTTPFQKGKEGGLECISHVSSLGAWCGSSLLHHWSSLVPVETFHRKHC